MSAAKYWNCRRCAHRNERANVKCRGEGCEGRRPKKPVRAHARTLRDDAYAAFLETSAAIHGNTDEACDVCGKPRSQERHHDRDHDHHSGRRRGLACGGNRGCNVLMVPWVTAATARGVAEAKRRAGEPDAERWALIAAYLERVEQYYAGQEAP
jgi:hypothetical protein